jgi:hypothetical protein
MQGNARWRFAALMFALTVFLGGCAHDQSPSVAAGDYDDDINIPPANYKPDILAAMHAYLNDPTGIRDAGIAEPALKTAGGNRRYVVCVRFNAKKARNDYAGVKEIAAVFVAGRFDRFVEPRHEAASDANQGECAGAVYALFPELGKLSR